MAREVLTNDEGRATAVSYVDTGTGKTQEVRAKIVVLAASACETARLLLNSKSSRHPEGLANSSGAVGRYLTDTTGTSVQGHIPVLEGLPPYNDDGAGGMHKLTGGGYGKKLKDDYRRLYGSIVGFSGRGEMLPNKDCYCEIDPSVVDRYG